MKSFVDLLCHWRVRSPEFSSALAIEICEEQFLPWLQLNLFQTNQPEANVQQAFVSQLNNNIQSGIQKRERRDLLGFCNSYCKPSLVAEQEATCKKTTAIALEKEAGLCKNTTAFAVKMAVEKTVGKEAELCKKTTANAVKMASEKTVEKEAGMCKKTTAIAVKMAVQKTVEKEAKSCKKSITDTVKSCKKNSVMFEMVGPFKSRPENKIGQITKYYHNYEFSMDLRFPQSDLKNNYPMQLLVGIV